MLSDTEISIIVNDNRELGDEDSFFNLNLRLEGIIEDPELIIQVDSLKVEVLKRDIKKIDLFKLSKDQLDEFIWALQSMRSRMKGGKKE